MAEALETDPINQLEENLQCSVCLGTLKNPRTLSCCHSFCKDCLEGVVKTCRDKAARDGRQIREFPCPDCRTMFTLEPDKHVADMPRNHFICNMVQVIAVLDRGTRVPCSHNCSQSSVARCVTCEKFLCRECLTVHNNYRGHNGHCVLTMEELSKPENRAKINGTMYCNEHSGMPLKVYCETCDQLICKDCMDFKHIKQNHSCLLVKDVASNYKELLASNNKAMEIALTEGNLYLLRLSRTTVQLSRNAKNAENEIVQRRDAMVKKVVAMLNQKAETLLNKVRQIHRDQREKLDKQTKETRSYVENIKQSVQLSKKLVDQGTEEEIISSQKMMLANSNNLLTKGPKYFKAPIPAVKINYTTSACKETLNKEMRAIANSLGEVNDDDQTRNESCKSNTKSAETSTSDGHSFSKPLSYSKAVAWITTKGKEKDKTPQFNDEICAMCLSPFTNSKTLDKCGDSFSAFCTDEQVKYQKKCPACSQVYGPLIGNQPPGGMTVSSMSSSLPGFEKCGTITITYKFEDGIQGPEHPNPGKRYFGTHRVAYLPENEEGRKVLKLLQKAFTQNLIFTIGRSSTTGANNVITWNDIHHKTRRTGGPTNFGYPDPGYLRRVQEELAAKGITE